MVISDTLCYGVPCTVYSVTLPSGSTAVIIAQITMGQLLLLFVLVAVLLSLVVVMVRQWMHS